MSENNFILDPSRFDEFLELGEKDGCELILQLIEMYKETVPERLALMRQHMDKSDFEKVSKEAHTLKSTGGNLGGKELQTVCAELESVAQQSTDNKLIQGLVDKVCHAHDRLLPELAKTHDTFSNRLKAKAA